jgi:N-acetylglucosaminyldiphosphoundecaprenol N-acetyl-beta-D-mannosaminyltransferase
MQKLRADSRPAGSRAVCAVPLPLSNLLPPTFTRKPPRNNEHLVVPPSTRYVRLTGARFAAVTEAQTVRSIVEAAADKRGQWTITANLDHLRRYRQDRVTRELMECADLVVADGMPLVWASRLVGAPLPERVSGSNMVWSISEAASIRQQSIFLIGGDPGVASRAAHILTARYSGLNIVGTLCPPVGFDCDPSELDRIRDQMVDADPQIVFVALGFPKQDLLIRRLRVALPFASFIGVGISLSFVAGDVSRAPVWVRAAGLEWLYRLLQEPGRLAHRYLIDGLPFAFRLLAAAVRSRVRARGAEIYWGWDTDT